MVDNIIVTDFFNSKTINVSEFLKIIKDKKINKVLCLCVASQEAKLKSLWAPSLTPLIGKDKITEFCNLFNKVSEDLYKEGLLIPVYFFFYSNKTYRFFLRTPSLFYIIKYILDIDKIYKKKYNTYYYLTIEEIYYICCIKSSSYTYINIFQMLKVFIKLLKNFGIKIIRK